MTTSTKPKRLVDVPLACGNCGSTDWREFRYRGENHDLDGKPRELFGTCTKCGQSHIFEQSEWKMVGAVGGVAMTKRDFTTLISELSEKERTSVEQWINIMLPDMFRRCECDLRDYGAGQQNVLKLLGVMDWTQALIADARSDLIKKHKLPFKSGPK